MEVGERAVHPLNLGGRRLGGNVQMCLAIPCRIVNRMDDGETALVELAGNRRSISLALTPEARVGDWVLVHVGVAIQVLDQEEAKASLAVWRELADTGAEGAGTARTGAEAAGAAGRGE